MIAINNFDGIFQASVTVFGLLIGDNWNYVLYDCLRAVGWGSCIYFITFMMFGNIIMLNLFLAILLGNFDRARHFHMKKSVFDMFRKQLGRKKTLPEALDYILVEELAEYIKVKIIRDKSILTLKSEEEEDNKI